MKKIIVILIASSFIIPALFLFTFAFIVSGGSSDINSSNSSAIHKVNVGAGDFTSPLDEGFSIFSEAGARRLDGYHYGMDMGKSYGSPVYAIYDGEIYSTNSSCPPNGGFLGSRCPTSGLVPWGGNSVVLKFVYKNVVYFAQFDHLEKVKAKINDKVKKGDQIGTQGNSGNSTGSHLHLEIHYDGVLTASKKNFVNPRDLINFE